ncbi:MAG: nucleotidyltransferase domain-containing protein [bacterium]|nr:nucleotidyltransferase domain-containing protein [bacterium]
MNDCDDIREQSLHIAREIADRLKVSMPNFKMRLYGSYARGEATEDSDIDIYIEVPQRYFSQKLKQIVSDIAWEIGFMNNKIIQTILYSDDQVWNTPRRASPFIHAIMKEGIPI